MRRPNLEHEKIARTLVRTPNGIEMRDQYVSRLEADYETLRLTSGDDALEEERNLMSRDVKEAIDSIIFIAEHLKKGDYSASVGNNDMNK